MAGAGGSLSRCGLRGREAELEKLQQLQRRLTESGSAVRSLVAHPGIATTNLVSHSGSSRINRFRILLNDPDRGALPTLFAATQDLPGNS